MSQKASRHDDAASAAAVSQASCCTRFVAAFGLGSTSALCPASAVFVSRLRAAFILRSSCVHFAAGCDEAHFPCAADVADAALRLTLTSRCGTASAIAAAAALPLPQPLPLVLLLLLGAALIMLHSFFAVPLLLLLQLLLCAGFV